MEYGFEAMPKFKGDQGAGIQNIFKNIVSFELVRVLMPVENFIIPFDNRIFVDYSTMMTSVSSKTFF